ncbi:LOW QUALITY PROTEIN: CKLF-like MARVEL transmembrane domain-containing protein 3 [Ciconia maguari]
MEEPEPEPAGAASPPGLRSLLPPREFLCSRKGQLLLAESVLSFIIFICYIASLAASFMMAPLLEFLLALFLFFAYASKLNEKFKGLYWPLTDFLRCVTAAVIYFAISIAAVSKYNDGASKAAGVFGFIATIVYAIDFYITFNDLVTFLKQGSSDSPEGHKSEDEASDSDSD